VNTDCQGEKAKMEFRALPDLREIEDWTAFPAKKETVVCPGLKDPLACLDFPASKEKLVNQDTDNQAILVKKDYQAFQENLAAKAFLDLKDWMELLASPELKANPAFLESPDQVVCLARKEMLAYPAFQASMDNLDWTDLLDFRELKVTADFLASQAKEDWTAIPEKRVSVEFLENMDVMGCRASKVNLAFRVFRESKENLAIRGNLAFKEFQEKKATLAYREDLDWMDCQAFQAQKVKVDFPALPAFQDKDIQEQKVKLDFLAYPVVMDFRATKEKQDNQDFPALRDSKVKVVLPAFPGLKVNLVFLEFPAKEALMDYPEFLAPKENNASLACQDNQVNPDFRALKANSGCQDSLDPKEKLDFRDSLEVLVCPVPKAMLACLGCLGWKVSQVQWGLRDPRQLFSLDRRVTLDHPDHLD